MGGDVVQWEDRRDVKEDNPNNTLTWCQEAWMRENSEEASQAIGSLLVPLERNFSLVGAQDWEMGGRNGWARTEEGKVWEFHSFTVVRSPPFFLRVIVI